MSTYYSIICNDCKERTDAASQTAGGRGCACGYSSETLHPFIVFHSGCNVRIVNEHQDEWSDEDYKEWTSDNYKEMFDRPKPN
jgi:hypothetical protein